MKTNQFYYKISLILGNSLEPEASSLKTNIFLIKNIFVLLYLIIFAIIPSVWFIIENFHDIPSLLQGIFQISAYGSCLLSFITMSFRKKKVHQFFNGFDLIVNKRQKITKFGLYDVAMKKSENYIKYPIICFPTAYVIQTILSLIYDITLDVIYDDIQIENWTLPTANM